jgi:protein-L-isoaspartate(D-aspartate) O-methyltransferase
MTEDRFNPDELAIVRRAYAMQMLANAGVTDDARLEDAFATVVREHFLGPPPWQVSRAFGYEFLPSANPALIYQDILLALSIDRGVNNGSPSLHARWLHAVQPRPGEKVAHIGAGAGYYTAMMAHIVGDGGHVEAIEIDPALATMARANLAAHPNVTVRSEDGVAAIAASVDVIYVNFAVSQPIKVWTDALNVGGRLIFPLGVPLPHRNGTHGWQSSRGAALLIQKHAHGLAVQWIGPVWFVCAEGTSASPQSEQDSLKAAFERGGIEFVKSLHWGKKPPSRRIWHCGTGWCLSYDSVTG